MISMSALTTDVAPAPRTDQPPANRPRTQSAQTSGPGGFSSLLGGDDLYVALAGSPATGGDRGRTAITESTESLDWDKAPIGPRG
jgi:hypothetical protein